MSNEIKCRVISKGIEEGEAIVTKDSISFLGGVDPDTGIVNMQNNNNYILLLLIKNMNCITNA